MSVIPEEAFDGCTSLTSLTIGSGVTTIGQEAFSGCTSLPSVTIPSSVTSIGQLAFAECTSLTSLTIGSGVTSIGPSAFAQCFSLTNLTIGSGVTSIALQRSWNAAAWSACSIPGSVTSIGDYAFELCNNLTSAYFQGNAPNADSTVFLGDDNATVYYLPGTTGWSSTFAGRPALLWNPLIQTGSGFGVRNNQFGFNITGTPAISPSWWKPAPIWPTLFGIRYRPSSSPMVCCVSPILSGRIIPAASTASPRHEDAA